jgi:HAAS
MSESGVEAIVSDYFSRLKQALAPLPRSRRDQLLDDLHEHVTMARADLADESELSVREILEHLGTPEEIAAEALAGSRRDGGRWRGRWPLGPGLAWFNEGRPVRRRAIASAAAVVVLTAGTCGVILTGDSPPPPASVKTDSAEMPLANSDCSPPTDAASSGGPAAALTSKATQVASGTVAGNHWSLWSARGHSGATGLEDGGLVINGRAYGLCPGFPNPAELEMAALGPAAIVYGVIGYPGRAKVQLYTSTAGTFDRGQPLPAPSVEVVHGVSFFIGTLPRSACDYPSLELNSAARQGSSQHNFGFGSCVTDKLVKITGSMGAWNVSG